MNAEFLTKELHNFIAELRLAGYNVGTTQFIAAQNLILVLIAQGKLPAEMAHLKTLLGAVLCHSPKEQDEFARHFDNWMNQIEPLVTTSNVVSTYNKETHSIESETKKSANTPTVVNFKTTLFQGIRC